jgi:uncharacterized protein (DUF1778 family)
MTPPPDARALRWNLRVEDSEDALVRAASAANAVSYSSFIRSAAVSEAQRVLADRKQFPLPPAQWDEFTQMLERPPRVPDGLRRLYARPSVLE